MRKGDVRQCYKRAREDRFERKGPLRPAPRGPGEARAEALCEKRQELSLARFRAVSWVRRPVPALLRCSPGLGSAFPLGEEGLCGSRLPPQRRSAHRRTGRGRACGGASLLTWHPLAGAPQSVWEAHPDPPQARRSKQRARPHQGLVTEPAPRLACWEGAAQGACCLEQELGCRLPIVDT